MKKTIVKPFIFTLIPMHLDFNNVYQAGIKVACFNAGADCERVDESIFAEGALERFNTQITKANIIISDVTGRNPDVLFETGFACALKKQVILLTQNVNDIPFDIKHYPHILYDENIVRLREEIEKRLQWNNLTKFL